MLLLDVVADGAAEEAPLPSGQGNGELSTKSASSDATSKRRKVTVFMSYLYLHVLACTYLAIVLSPNYYIDKKYNCRRFRQS